jgi:hypothetical protein
MLYFVLEQFMYDDMLNQKVALGIDQSIVLEEFLVSALVWPAQVFLSSSATGDTH